MRSLPLGGPGRNTELPSMNDPALDPAPPPSRHTGEPTFPPARNTPAGVGGLRRRPAQWC
eukprot:4795709-Alexandrium_andersonii.AAC.1